MVESRLGTVTVDGDRWFSAGQSRSQIQLRSGEPIDSAELKRDLDWINRNPYRHATTVASPGAEPGTTNLTIRTQERLPLSINAGVDNTGNTSTGLERPSVGVDWGNFLGHGDDLSYQLTLSGDGRSLRQHGLSYTGYLPWRHVLMLTGSLVTFDLREARPFRKRGGATRPTPGTSLPIHSGSRFGQQFTGGFDFKNTNNNLLFGGVSIFNQVAAIEQFSANYGANLSDRRGQTSVDVAVTFSPGGLTGHNSNAAFDSRGRAPRPGTCMFAGASSV